MLFGNHVEGVGYGPLFGYTKLVAAQWLLGSGLDDVFVGKLNYYIFNCCSKVLRCIPEDSAESSVFHCVIVSNEVSDLDGILVMQNKLRVSYCNYSFVGEQRHPRTVGKYRDVIRREVCRVGFDQRNPKPETRNRLLKLVSNCETRNPKPETDSEDLTSPGPIETRNPKPKTRNPKPTLKTYLPQDRSKPETRNRL